MSQIELNAGELYTHKTNSTHSIKPMWSEANGHLWAVEVYSDYEFIQACLMTGEQIKKYYSV